MIDGEVEGRRIALFAPWFWGVCFFIGKDDMASLTGAVPLWTRPRPVHAVRLRSGEVQVSCCYWAGRWMVCRKLRTKGTACMYIHSGFTALRKVKKVVSFIFDWPCDDRDKANVTMAPPSVYDVCIWLWVMMECLRHGP